MPEDTILCGIVGYATSKHKWAYEKFFKQALVADVLRGLDSTGIIVGGPRKVEYFKKACNSLDFLDMKPADKLIDSVPINASGFMIGHNRAATVGSVTSANAHPFHHGDIIGVHNGTLRRFTKLERHNDFSTDSEALYFNLSRNPIEEVLGKVEGAYTLVWYDHSDDTVNIVKNEERPLSIAKVKDEDTILWASEPAMLRWIAGRNAINIESMITPKEHQHIKIHVDSDEVSKFEVIPLNVVSEYPTVYNGYSGYGGYGGQSGKVGKQGSGQGSSGSNSSQRKNTGQTMSPSEIIKKFDLTLNDKKYPVYCHEFTPYETTPKYGVMTGYMMEWPYLEVQFRGVNVDVYAEYGGEEVEVPFRSISCQDSTPWKAAAIADHASLVSTTSSVNARYVGPDGKKISTDEMLQLTKCGCKLCHSGISIQEFDFVDWIEDEPVCPSCVEQDYSAVEC